MSDFKIIHSPLLHSKKKKTYTPYAVFSYSLLVFINISLTSLHLSYLCSLLFICLTFPLSYLAISWTKSSIYLFFFCGPGKYFLYVNKQEYYFIFFSSNSQELRNSGFQPMYPIIFVFGAAFASFFSVSSKFHNFVK